MNDSKALAALAGKNVFITGTTGFVGKVVLEKLLRSVPSIGKIYLLIRGSKKHPKAADRFANEIAQSSIFQQLKSEGISEFQSLCERHLEFVDGELTDQYFGLDEESFKRLADNVDLIINSAASVNFREALDAALRINTLCLNNIVALSRCGGDVPVVQVSTCYVNGFNRGVIEEENISPAGEAIERSAFGYFEVESLIEELQALASRQSQQAADKADEEKRLIDLGIEVAQRFGWNDTYTFTKWLGEQLLMKAMYGKALTIVRPSIVESTLAEPTPGWIEGVKVADAIILAYAREKVSVFPGRKKAILDVIPADLVANSIILSAAEVLSHPADLRLYQCCSSEANPVRLSELISFVQEVANENHESLGNLFLRRPSKPFVMVPGVIFKWLMRSMHVGLTGFHGMLALLGQGTDARALKKFETTMKLALIFSFYTSPNYTFSNRKLVAMAERMSAVDRREFPVDAADYDWKRYMQDIHLPGLNRYALRPRRASTAEQPALKHQRQTA